MAEVGLVKLRLLATPLARMIIQQENTCAVPVLVGSQERKKKWAESPSHPTRQWRITNLQDENTYIYLYILKYTSNLHIGI